jgi:MFS family permease
MSIAEKRPPLFNANLRWFMTGIVLANIAGNMAYSMMAIYMEKDFSASVEQIGLVFSVAGFAMTAMQVFGGWISDTIGRLRAVAIGSTLACLGYIGFFLAPSWEWMIPALCIEYISGATVAPSYGAYISEQSSEETRGRVFGIADSTYMVVAVVGGPLAGFLAYNFGFRVLYFVAMLIYFSATAVRLWMVFNPRFASAKPPKQLTLSSLKQQVGGMFALVVGGGLVTWIFVTDGVRDIAFRLSGNLQPLYLAEVGKLNEQDIGILNAIFGAAMMAITIPAGWLADRFSERKMIMVGFVLEFCSFVVFISAREFWGFALAWLVLGVGIGVMAPAYDSIISKAVPEHLRGTAFGLFYTSMGLLSFYAPSLGSYLWARYTPQLPFIITACATLLAVIPVWFRFKLPKKEGGK